MGQGVHEYILYALAKMGIYSSNQGQNFIGQVLDSFLIYINTSPNIICVSPRISSLSQSISNNSRTSLCTSGASNNPLFLNPVFWSKINLLKNLEIPTTKFTLCLYFLKILNFNYERIEIPNYLLLFKKYFQYYTQYNRIMMQYKRYNDGGIVAV